eukprot:CAMPEP_0179960880 /NCGR_PEP_ID=MMETSP0983-20121128/29378_1 /TAXON_ID=483367 /ORGANISM="non described non described, Strain CCMP 2436" /LENGTH=85 /DNA_ID=CAMNT_0021873263 /DNA_START=128 /DNA_END=381 /DNA_ORIENTATION=+
MRTKSHSQPHQPHAALARAASASAAAARCAPLAKSTLLEISSTLNIALPARDVRIVAANLSALTLYLAVGSSTGASASRRSRIRS